MVSLHVTAQIFWGGEVISIVEHFHVFQFPANRDWGNTGFGICAADLEREEISFSGLYSLTTTRKASGSYCEWF